MPDEDWARLSGRIAGMIVYEIVDRRVTLAKAPRGGKIDDPFRTFVEWSSEADAIAYADL